MLKRNVDSLLIRTVSSSVAEVVDVAGKRFMLLCGNNSFTLGESVSRIHYLVVCAGFRGDIVKAVASMSPDSVLLSSDLNNRRHNRYMDELARAGIPVRSIKTLRSDYERRAGCMCHIVSYAPLARSSRYPRLK